MILIRESRHLERDLSCLPLIEAVRLKNDKLTSSIVYIIVNARLRNMVNCFLVKAPWPWGLDYMHMLKMAQACKDKESFKTFLYLDGNLEHQH